MRSGVHHFLKSNRSGWPSKPADGGAVSQDRAPGRMGAACVGLPSVHLFPRRAYQGRRVSIVPRSLTIGQALKRSEVPPTTRQGAVVIVRRAVKPLSRNVNVEREKHHQNPQLRRAM